MQRKDLVAQAVVAGTGIALSEFGGEVKKAQCAHAICGSHTDNSVAREMGPIRDTTGRAFRVAAAIDPDQHGMRTGRDRYPHIQIKTILADNNRTGSCTAQLDWRGRILQGRPDSPPRAHRTRWEETQRADRRLRKRHAKEGNRVAGALPLQRAQRRLDDLWNLRCLRQSMQPGSCCQTQHGSARACQKLPQKLSTTESPSQYTRSLSSLQRPGTCLSGK